MGYYLMKCRQNLKEKLLEKLKGEDYDQEKKAFYVTPETIKEIEDVFYKYGFSERVMIRELEMSGLRINKEKSLIERTE
jgi:hypothetical protein